MSSHTPMRQFQCDCSPEVAETLVITAVTELRGHLHRCDSHPGKSIMTLHTAEEGITPEKLSQRMRSSFGIVLAWREITPGQEAAIPV